MTRRFHARPYKQHTTRRDESHRHYMRRAWRDIRAGHIRANPLCCQCGRAAAEVDHITPHKGDLELFYDASNLQSLCKSCHSRKTATEDGGFGRAVAKRDKAARK